MNQAPQMAPPLLVKKVVVGAAWYAVAPLRAALVALARRGPAPAPDTGAAPSATFLLSSAWGVGGTIRAVLNLAGHLAGRGYDVHVITMYRRREEPFFGDFPPGVTVTALHDQRRHPARRAAATPPAASVLARVPSVLVHPGDRVASSASLWSDVRLVRLLRARRGHLIGTRPAFNLLVAALASPRFIAVGQEHMHLSAHGRSLRRTIRRNYPKLDALGVLTEQDRRDYDELLRGRAQVVRIPNAVAGEFGRHRPDLAARTVVAAGRIGPQKGFDLLVSAFGEVVRMHPDWSLRIYGAGDTRREIVAQVERLGLERSIALPGPAKRLDREMAKASIFALSSRYEGFPLTLLEAMSTGLAIAAFDCPTGPRDVIDDGVNGLLVPAEDVDGLAAALRRLIEDPELRARCADGARATARHYALDVIGGRWDELLRRLERRRTELRPVCTAPG